MAALWLAVDGTGGCRLHLANYQGDRRYLNEIGRRLMRCELPPHTQVGEHSALDLPLRLADGEGGHEMRLIVPDLSGETWQHALEEAEWTAELDGRIQSAAGVIVFVHSQASSSPTVGPLSASLPAQGQAPATTPFDLTQISADSQLVQLIQMLGSRRRDRRIALIISAWDLVEPGTSPQQWIDENCKLLSQFMQSRHDVDLRVWGVSAQGGKFDDPAEVEHLIREDAIARLTVCDADGNDGSIADPVLWATGWETA
jgi:hypothetical protein